MLSIESIHKSFGRKKVLKGISFNLLEGTICTLIGGNGTGKTTLFNIITRYIRQDKGSIIFENKKITTKNSNRVNQLGISRTFQDLRLINILTVKENILLAFKKNPGEKILNAMLPKSYFSSEYKKLSKKADDIIEKIGLKHVSKNYAGEISYGQQKLLTLGCCLANNAKLMLLDEPVAGIDEEHSKHILKLIKKLKNDGKTILQIEHNLDFIKKSSDKLFFLNNGVSLEFNSYRAFRANRLVRKVYLN